LTNVLHTRLLVGLIAHIRRCLHVYYYVPGRIFVFHTRVDDYIQIAAAKPGASWTRLPSSLARFGHHRSFGSSLPRWNVTAILRPSIRRLCAFCDSTFWPKN